MSNAKSLILKLVESPDTTLEVPIPLSRVQKGNHLDDTLAVKLATNLVKSHIAYHPGYNVRIVSASTVDVTSNNPAHGHVIVAVQLKGDPNDLAAIVQNFKDPS